MNCCIEFAGIKKQDNGNYIKNDYIITYNIDMCKWIDKNQIIPYGCHKILTKDEFNKIIKDLLQFDYEDNVQKQLDYNDSEYDCYEFFYG